VVSTRTFAVHRPAAPAAPVQGSSLTWRWAAGAGAGALALALAAAGLVVLAQRKNVSLSEIQH
jgi:hypothetical protein